MPLILSVIGLLSLATGNPMIPPSQHTSTADSLPHSVNQTHLLKPHNYSVHPARRSGLRPHTPQHYWDRRSPGHLAMYECHYANWAGECRLVNADGGACHNIQWPNTAAPGYSIGPDKGLRCVIFSEPNCNSSSTIANNFIWPGFADFSTNATWSNWGRGNKDGSGLNGLASYQCYVQRGICEANVGDNGVIYPCGK